MNDEYYDQLSKGYDELYGREQLDKIEFLMPWLKSLAGFTLDLGAGTGLLNKRFESSVSVDSSLEMLKKNTGQNRVLCDARFLPFKDDSFDSLISITMLQDVRDKNRVLREVKRVCKGAVILTVLKRNYSKGKLDSLFTKYFDILFFDIQEKDYCYYLKRKAVKKIKKLRIRI